MSITKCLDQGLVSVNKRSYVKSNQASYLTFFSFAGGFAKISTADIDGSSKFLKFLLKSSESLGTERALDCGAGIGRITKHLLSKHFKKVNQKYTLKAARFIHA